MRKGSDTRDRVSSQMNRQVGEAIQHAAVNLPENYTIDIEIGYGSAVVTLNGPDGECEFPSNHEGLQDEIEDAVEFAIEQATGKSTQAGDRYRQIATAVVDEAMRGYSGQADRLVLMVDGQDDGGWGRDPLIVAIARVLETELAASST